MPDDCALFQQGQNAVRADGNRRRDNPLLVDQVRDWRREHTVQPRNLPVLLQRDGERDAVFRHLVQVRVDAAAAHHEDVACGALDTELLQLRRKLVARAAFRIGKDEKHPPPFVLRQRNFGAADARQLEVGRDGPGFQAVTHQSAFLEWIETVNRLLETIDPFEHAAILGQKLENQPAGTYQESQKRSAGHRQSHRDSGAYEARAPHVAFARRPPPCGCRRVCVQALWLFFMSKHRRQPGRARDPDRVVGGELAPDDIAGAKLAREDVFAPEDVQAVGDSNQVLAPDDVLAPEDVFTPEDVLAPEDVFTPHDVLAPEHVHPPGDLVRVNRFPPQDVFAPEYVLAPETVFARDRD